MQTVGQVHNADLVENADCRPGTKCRLRIYTVFILIRDNNHYMSSYNLPGVMQSLFRDHFSRLFSLLWNIPCPFLDHNRS